MGKLVFLSYPENCESAAFVKTASAIEFNIDVADSREERAVFFCSVKHILIYIRGSVVINLFVCAQDLMFAMNNLHCISSMETGILPKYQPHTTIFVHCFSYKRSINNSSKELFVELVIIWTNVNLR